MLIIDVILAIITMAALIVLYFLSRRFVRLSTVFNGIATLITTVTLIEKSLLDADIEDVH